MRGGRREKGLLRVRREVLWGILFGGWRMGRGGVFGILGVRGKSLRIGLEMGLRGMRRLGLDYKVLGMGIVLYV